MGKRFNVPRCDKGTGRDGSVGSRALYSNVSVVGRRKHDFEKKGQKHVKIDKPGITKYAILSQGVTA